MALPPQRAGSSACCTFIIYHRSLLASRSRRSSVGSAEGCELSAARETTCSRYRFRRHHAAHRTFGDSSLRNGAITHKNHAVPTTRRVTIVRISTICAAAGIFAASTIYSAAAVADNPIVQTNYTADPAPMVHDGRLYLYTSHDEDVTVKDFFTMNDWRLYSTVDMVNWTDHGSPAGYKTFSWGTGDAWAIQVVVRNGKFYLYVPINNSTGSKIGVAVATNPAGPFTDPIGKALISTGSGNI